MNTFKLARCVGVAFGVPCFIIYTFKNSACTKCRRWRHLFLSHSDPEHSSVDVLDHCRVRLNCLFRLSICAILHWIFGWTATIHMEMLFCDAIRETPLNFVPTNTTSMQTIHIYDSSLMSQSRYALLSDMSKPVANMFALLMSKMASLIKFFRTESFF